MADATRRAQLIIEAKDAVTGETDKAARSLGGLKSSLSNLNQAAGAMVKSFIGPAAIIGALKGSIDAAMEAQRVMTQTEAVIKSTGGAAGLTAEEIEKLAGAESRLTSIDDEVIQSGQNMLLTFTNIGGEVFPRATRAMQDMAVAFAQGDTSAIDLQGTAIQLGKALQDPERGLLALRRVGVNFTESQKDTIKQMMAMNDDAFNKHVKDMVALLKDGTVTLDDFDAEILRSATVAGKTSQVYDDWGNIIGQDLNPAVAEQVRLAMINATAYKDMGERMLDAASAAEELTGPLEETKEALDANSDSLNHLKGLMAGAVGDEMTRFNEKQDELRAKAGELQATISTSYGKARDDARASLEDVNKSLADNAAAHEEATKRILFGIAEQQLASDGLTAVELQALNNLASQWGLVDQATADATEAILAATGQLASDENPELFVEKLDAISKAVTDGVDPAIRSATEAYLFHRDAVWSATVNTADMAGAVEDATPKVNNLTPQLSGAAGAAGALAGAATAP